MTSLRGLTPQWRHGHPDGQVGEMVPVQFMPPVFTRNSCSGNAPSYFSSYLGLLHPLTFDLVLLRYRQHSLALMEAYDPTNNVWLKLSDMETPCSGLAACALFGLLYTVGASVLL